MISQEDVRRSMILVACMMAKKVPKVFKTPIYVILGSSDFLLTYLCYLGLGARKSKGTF